MYAVVQSVSDMDFAYGVRDMRLRTRLGKRYGLERIQRFVPIESITEPAYVRPNDIGEIDGEVHAFDNTIVLISNKREWASLIL